MSVKACWYATVVGERDTTNGIAQEDTEGTEERRTKMQTKQSQAVTWAQAVKDEEKADLIDHHRVFMGYLIGKPIRRDAHGLPTLEEVRRGLWQKFPALKEAEL